jgi:microtubule-associated protein-like 6
LFSTGAIVAPTNAPRNDCRAPSSHLALEWAHGYRCQDAHSNAFLTAGGGAASPQLVYPTASLVVALDDGGGDVARRKQTHMRGHSDAVSCLARHPTRHNVFASGQRATLDHKQKHTHSQRPHVCVHDADTGIVLASLPAYHARAVIAIAFSPCGRFLATVGGDDRPRL